MGRLHPVRLVRRLVASPRPWFATSARMRALGIFLPLAILAASLLGGGFAFNPAAAQSLGGRTFTLISRSTGAVELTWSSGTGQTGYRLNRITSTGTVAVAPTIAATGTSFTDQLGTGVAVACYQLEILSGTNVAGRSDVLCAIVNEAAGTHAPRNVTVFTNETPNVGIRWDAPTQTSPAIVGYLVVPLGRTVLPGDAGVFSPNNRVALDLTPRTFGCYMVLALVPDSALVPFKIGGFSDIVCAAPGTFSPQGTSPTLTGTATPTRTATVAASGTATPPASSSTATNTPISQGATLTTTATSSVSPSSVVSTTPGASSSPTATTTATPSSTSSFTLSPVSSVSPTPTPSISVTPVFSLTPCFDCPSPTPSVTPTPCPSCPTATTTPTPTITTTFTPSATVVTGGVAWVRKADMLTRRGVHAVAVGPDNRIYVFGGGQPDVLAFNTVEAYDPVTNTWTARANMPTARQELAAATAPNGRIYVAGGAASRADAVALTTLEEYDPITNTWASRAPMPTARIGLALVTAPNGRLYAIGGYSTAANTALSHVEEYDPTTNQWTRRADMPTPRTRFGATLGSDGRIYAVGGDFGGFAPQATLEVYDPIANSWQTRAPMPSARPEGAAATAANGRIYVVGGFLNNVELRLVEEYTPATDSWVRRADMLDRRRGPGLAAANGRLYAIGGFGGTGEFGDTLNSVEEGTLF